MSRIGCVTLNNSLTFPCLRTIIYEMRITCFIHIGIQMVDNSQKHADKVLAILIISIIYIANIIYNICIALLF